ncbi:MAG: guanylate kinase [Deltaproteobacteria bacterium]|nr:guanylate kinase [Deltaproteobacteria bacterium]
MKQNLPGKLIIVSAPSGAGKTTLCDAMVRHFDNLVYSISYTTRAPRHDEKEGEDYFFISEHEFKKHIKNNNWAEWAKVHDHYYGTHASFISENLSVGRDILLDIDVQGAKQIIQRYPDSTTIFIMPPSLDVLRIRLESRGTDSKEVIDKRLENAKQEIDKKGLYQHIIVNDDLENAINELITIIHEKNI